MGTSTYIERVPRGTPLFRFFEMIPGVVLWTALSASVALSFVRPVWIVVFMICFSFYWLLRVLYFIVYLVASWGRFRRDIVRDWTALLDRDFPSAWKDVHHLVFLPTYTESVDVIRKTFVGLQRAHCPPGRMTVVLAGEARAGADAFHARARAIEDEFGDAFDILITVHPTDLPDEIPGKGSNLHYAGKQALAHLAARDIRTDHVLVSAFDIDTVVHLQYFACLTWTFLSHPDRYHTSYQPVALYNNNMWESPSFMRVAAFGTTFWLLTELMRPDRLFTFSSHSMPLTALVEVGFWEKDIVTEDSRIFLQCFIRYAGNYTVTPLFVPVSMYTAKAGTFWQSVVNLYKQQRRWMWGVEHFPYMVWHFFFGSGRTIALGKKVKYLWNLGEGMFSMATAPLLLFIFSRLPLAVLRRTGGDSTVIAQTAPHVLEWLLAVAMVGIFASALFALTLIPKRPRSSHPASFIVHVLQWLLLPFTLILFGAFPAIEAQTRLMIGKYLGFYVAKKSH
ncbi:MAG: glycosyltransferase family 2 protein [bacterium]|nr:glycosyltransferase family 2 protein [bacterium]